ncbi:hypothetical protein GIB67_022577 [Kingdonia uniflora]|uniref:Nucleolar protein 12 n=1 Tax=Kingdonia uniflora TaxID=39325 RepID=A0A7J7L7H8_9MAGN|nr:hypothetical protein GIB67_022577 [Kingdonia uniflora]
MCGFVIGRDYVTGFQKRKNKRRKQAQVELETKLRLKRIENRKKRKQEREYVQGGKAPLPMKMMGVEEIEQPEQVSGFDLLPRLKTYENDDMKIIVTTNMISSDHVERPTEKFKLSPRSSGETAKHKIKVSKKPLKKVAKTRSSARPQKKREKRKGNKKSTTK